LSLEKIKSGEKNKMRSKRRKNQKIKNSKKKKEKKKLKRKIISASLKNKRKTPLI